MVYAGIPETDKWPYLAKRNGVRRDSSYGQMAVPGETRDLVVANPA